MKVYIISQPKLSKFPYQLYIFQPDAGVKIPIIHNFAKLIFYQSGIVKKVIWYSNIIEVYPGRGRHYIIYTRNTLPKANKLLPWECYNNNLCIKSLISLFV